MHKGNEVGIRGKEVDVGIAGEDAWEHLRRKIGGREKTMLRRGGRLRKEGCKGSRSPSKQRSHR